MEEFRKVIQKAREDSKMALIFDSNDSDYLMWLNEHPHGFVINSYRYIDKEWIVLHRAACSSISKYTRMAQPGGFTERQFVKICDDTVDGLRDWVRDNVGEENSSLHECGRCKPTKQ